MLIGRQAQLAQIAAVLDSAGAGRASVLRVVGGPGLGKTSLLDAAAAAAIESGMRVVRLVALEVEQELHGAGLDLLMRALGAPTASPSALGLLEALEGASRDAPLLVCLDDVQWLDRQAIAAVSFAARRLLADPVAVLLAGRPESDRIPGLAPFPRLDVPVLSEEEGQSLLLDIVPGMPAETARRVTRALAGVPLALHEVGSILPGDVLAGLAALPEPLPVSAAIQDRYARGFWQLGAESRSAVVLLAADTTGDPTVVSAALQRAGLQPTDLSSAEDVGLVRLIPTPGFVHPLARAAVHAAAHPAEVRSANAALAAVLSEAGDQIAALRHRVACTVPPDAALAGELTAASESLAQDPGAREGAAEAALQAARFTPDRAERARLQVVAAEIGGSPPGPASGPRAAGPPAADGPARAVCLRPDDSRRLRRPRPGTRRIGRARLPAP